MLESSTACLRYRLVGRRLDGEHLINGESREHVRARKTASVLGREPVDQRCTATWAPATHTNGRNDCKTSTQEKSTRTGERARETGNGGSTPLTPRPDSRPLSPAPAAALPSSPRWKAPPFCYGSGWTFLLHVSRNSRPAFELNSFPSASLACEWGMNIALQSSALGS